MLFQVLLCQFATDEFSVDTEDTEPLGPWQVAFAV